MAPGTARAAAGDAATTAGKASGEFAEGIAQDASGETTGETPAAGPAKGGVMLPDVIEVTDIPGASGHQTPEADPVASAPAAVAGPEGDKASTAAGAGTKPVSPGLQQQTDRKSTRLNSSH